MSQIALPEMRRYGYDDRLATGSVAAGGTIGILIPPSVLMVIYGLLTETSISELFMAGILPGILTVIVFMLTISIVTRLYPKYGPPAARSTLGQRMLALRDVWGTLGLFLLVIGGLYLGIFSPTEAASIGAQLGRPGRTKAHSTRGIPRRDRTLPLREDTPDISGIKQARQ
jgi:TRAP-type C4-dicarboxylate transport system permease large subunit